MIMMTMTMMMKLKSDGAMLHEEPQRDHIQFHLAVQYRTIKPHEEDFDWEHKEMKWQRAAANEEQGEQEEEEE